MPNKTFVPQYSPKDGSFVPLFVGDQRTFGSESQWPPHGICVEFYLLESDSKPLTGLAAKLGSLTPQLRHMTVFVAMKDNERRVIFGQDVTRWREIDSSQVHKLEDLYR